ncbi:MAG: class I SAM-dependent methyltransferase [bacterium]|nr:class I SAM-dependent methyltransferase [bacterium]
MEKSDTSQAVGQFFDGYASDFDAIYGHTGKRSFIGRWVDRQFRGVMMRRFAATLKQTNRAWVQSVLDVGCGSGRYVIAFAKQGKSVVGVDMAEGMLRLAQKAVEEAGLADRVTLVSADYLTAAFDRPFDVACLMGFFDYIENPVAVLEKLGREVTREIYASFPIAGGWLAWQRKVRYRARKCPLWLYRREDVVAIMDRAGFAGRYEIENFERDWYVTIRLRA